MSISSLDTSLFLAVNGLVGRYAALDALGVFAAVRLIFLLALAGIARAIWLAWRSDRRAAEALAGIPRAFCAVIAGLFVKYALLAAGLMRARPYVALQAAHRLVTESGDPQSFPSGHATAAFAIAFTSLAVDPVFGSWMLAGAVLVSLGRVYVGVHYPFDVLAGAVSGLLWAWLMQTIGRRLGDARAIAGILAKFRRQPPSSKS